MIKRSPDKWSSILQQCDVPQATAALWIHDFSEFFQGNVFSSGDGELDDFLSQILHESNRLRAMSENLNYSAKGLVNTWPNRFPTIEFAQTYVGNPQRIANKVYGGRFGNNLEGDGWKYRGSGLIQMTFLDNFKAVEKVTGIPIVANPELVRTPGRTALVIAHQWWEKKVPDALMDKDEEIRKKVNGGTIGLDDTKALAIKLRRILNA